MFRKILLRDFQRHRRKCLRLDRRITVLIGPTDSGKSTVLRALRYLCLNKLRGTHFIRHGQGRSVIKVWFDKGVVSRVRGKSDNLYKLNKSSFKAFGANKVPDPIVAALRVSEVNFQRQGDYPFWFSESAGQVSQRLNELADLQAMDHVLDRLAKRVRSTQAKLEVAAERKNAAEATVRALDWVPQCAADANRLADYRARLDATAVHLTAAERSARECRRLQRAADRSSSVALDGLKLIRAGDVFYATAQTRSSLSSLVDKVKSLDRIAGKDIDFSVVEKSRQKGDSHAERTQRLDGMIYQIEQLQDDLTWLETEVKKSEAKLSRKKNMCPACGRPLRSPSSAATYTSDTNPPAPERKKVYGGTRLWRAP